MQKYFQKDKTFYSIVYVVFDMTLSSKSPFSNFEITWFILQRIENLIKSVEGIS